MVKTAVVTPRNALNRQLPLPQDKWNARFGWIWYNDQEIFHDSEDDLDRKVRAFADQKINHLITFSCTHFRWSFRRWWPQLTETLAALTRCCHLHGIHLTEHHSAIFTHNPLDRESEIYWGNVLRVRKSSFASWPELLQDSQTDPPLEGVHLAEMRQVQGNTGTYTYSPYRGYVLCPNNPVYREVYFNYLQSLYEIGIDGIMTDDLHFVGQGCACVHCRALFKERYGYTMPETGRDWKAWYGDYDTPSYRAWLDFRYRSIEDFHLAVDRHYESLGLRLLRPDYQSHCLNWNLLASCLETKPTLDWVFQECCFSTVIRYSWIHFLIEQTHRQMVSRQRGIPHMMMFYPDRDDTLRFSWALARYSGALYTATPEGASSAFSEKPLREFEEKHRSALFGAVKVADIAFFDSKRNRELNPAFWHLSGLGFWMQACIMDNLQFELVQAEEAELLQNYKVIVLVKQALLSDAEIELLKQYVRNGGTLLFHQKAGTLDMAGARRCDAELSRLWDFAFSDVPDGQEAAELPCGKGRFVFVNDSIADSFPFVEKDGRIIEDSSDYMYSLNVDRWTEKENPVVCDSKYQRLHDKQTKLAALVRAYAGHPLSVEMSDAPEGVLVSLFQENNGRERYLHLVNAVNCFEVPEGASLGHGDPIPFPDLTAYGNAEIILREKDGLAEVIQDCHYFSLETDAGIPLEYRQQKDVITILFPLRLLHDYGLIKIEST